MTQVTFPLEYGGDGRTYSDVEGGPNTMVSGGHRLNFIPSLSGSVDMATFCVARAKEVENFASMCEEARDAAQQSATNAAISATASEASRQASQTARNQSRDFATAAANSASSVNAGQIVHAPGSGLPNEAGQAYSRSVVGGDGPLMAEGFAGVGIQRDTLNILFNNDFNTFNMFCGSGTTANNWLNGPLGSNVVHSGILDQKVRSFDNMTIQTWQYISGNVAITFVRSGQASLRLWYPWRLSYNSGNIVGGVSQANSIPTGSIMESGKNSFGEWEKFADGTLNMWIEANCTSSNTGAVFTRVQLPQNSVDFVNNTRCQLTLNRQPEISDINGNILSNLLNNGYLYWRKSTANNSSLEIGWLNSVDNMSQAANLGVSVQIKTRWF